jgi:3-dehydroquinate dehydratase-2
MAKPIFILNGPNLNLLGVREPHIYGSATLQDAQTVAQTRAAALGETIEFRQTNHEGVLVDWIQEARLSAKALVLNAAALTHTSLAVHDALKALSIPVVECHLSNPAAREPVRHVSFVASAARGVVAGFGIHSYALAVEAAAHAAKAA